MTSPAPLIILAALALALGTAEAKTTTKAKPAAAPSKTYARPAPTPEAAATAAADQAARDEADCAALASQQSGYDPARAQAMAAQQAASDKGAQGAAKKGGRFLGKIPVTTIIGGPKSIAMGAATGLAGSQVAKSGGMVGDAASGAANMMSKVPIPTTQQVAGAVGVDIPGSEEEKAKAQKAAFDKARAQCLQGKGYARD